MTSDVPPTDFGQTHPGLGLLRMASLLAEAQTDEPDVDALVLMSRQVDAGVLKGAAPDEVWAELRRGIMGAAPSRMIATLRACGALAIVLPEVAALFGVPQMSEGQSDVDLGPHLMNGLDEAAAVAAPLSVRFALLVMNVGKSDSPREHLPAHYRHIERGTPRIKGIAARFDVPPECRELALLALAECERVHRVSKMRAGPVAAMLERLGAFDAPDRFGRLMTVCACDFRAHDGRAGQVYPKAALLELARSACDGVKAGDDPDATQTARAEAIARAFRSVRWSDETVDGN
ncbi:tRNA nucleotidyltransferase [Methylocystis parvus]|uniref:tRNA nucleotidyltransferase n=1 Tax=Methylocystis parvus TaxID=134 RepID=A0A6B8M5B3_9HYPH|nr:tRNA nucleotidyltransferase [Methylocystis parvus]QGM98121.1 tRNA nucleotidyltransferase [Methylocystis parvus]WBK01557.1 tRNA nucleotidyltransferase [Methylocystis parvus OBBP]